MRNIIYLIVMLIHLNLNGQNQIKSSVISAGATNSFSSTIFINGTLGQLAIGLTNRSEVFDYQGFWYCYGSKLPTKIIELKEKSQINDVIIFPNPFTNEAYITFYLQQPGKIRLSLLNNLGLNVFNTTEEQTYEGKNTIKLIIGEMSTGTYWLKIQTKYNSSIHPVVIL